MKPKLIIIFLLLVLSPLALLAWLGWRATADEQARVRSTISEAHTNQLISLRSLIHETITKREREFTTLLDPDLSNRPGQIRDLVRRERFVRQIFITSGEGKFVHPPTSRTLCTQPEIDFYERTKSIWSSGEKFFAYDIESNALAPKPPDLDPEPEPEPDPLPQPDPNQQQQLDQTTQAQSRAQVGQIQLPLETNTAWVKQQEAAQYTAQNYPAQSVAPQSFTTDQGWHTWFHGDGVQMIYWRHIPHSGLTLGVEVDREAIMAEVIAKLPNNTGAGSGSIVLTDASARPIYQWGELEPAEDDTPGASIPLFPPLSMWHLNHYAPATETSKLSTGTVLGLVSGIIAAAVALLALAIYFYRENSREMRTAAEKVTFVNQVSHELKTPLTNIRMYAELAEEKLPGEDGNGARRCLDIVVNESQRLSRLIGNVLTFAKPKVQQPNPTPHVPDTLVNETLDHFRPSLEAQKIEIEFQAGAAEEVKIDADVLEQVLGNLLSNVEKYAASGGRLEITSAQQEGTTTITVSDEGPGIPKNQREKIFKPFHRLSNKNSDGVSGTGIGLTIARDLAKKHGGDLILSEKKNTSGCHFTLTLREL